MRTPTLVRAVVLAVVLVGVVAPDPASGAPKSFSRRVSGPYAGTSSFEFATPLCGFVHQVFDGTYTIPNGSAGAFHLDGCVDTGGQGFAWLGTFRVITPKGAVLTGTADGSVGTLPVIPNPCAQPEEFAARLDITLSVTRGTAGYKRATGSLRLTGVWCSQGPVGILGGPISGNLVGDLRHRGGT